MPLGALCNLYSETMFLSSFHLIFNPVDEKNKSSSSEHDPLTPCNMRLTPCNMRKIFHGYFNVNWMGIFLGIYYKWIFQVFWVCLQGK